MRKTPLQKAYRAVTGKDDLSDFDRLRLSKSLTKITAHVRRKIKNGQDLWTPDNLPYSPHYTRILKDYVPGAAGSKEQYDRNFRVLGLAGYMTLLGERKAGAFKTKKTKGKNRPLKTRGKVVHKKRR